MVVFWKISRKKLSRIEKKVGKNFREWQDQRNFFFAEPSFIASKIPAAFHPLSMISFLFEVVI